MFFSGFRSDMQGSKALYLDAYCREQGISFTRFDYGGHGDSRGAFEEGTIGSWLEDALAVLDKVAEGRLILVGSSMGAWIALLAALRRPERVAGLLLLAAAPDFTEELIWQKLTPPQQKELRENGVLHVPTDYPTAPGQNTYPITLSLIEEARSHLLLGADIPIEIPVRLLHGTADEDVPFDVSRRLLGRLKSKDAKLIPVEQGDHRLSSETALEMLKNTLEELMALCEHEAC